jgi:hypothetical protein
MLLPEAPRFSLYALLFSPYDMEILRLPEIRAGPHRRKADEETLQRSPRSKSLFSNKTKK